MPGLKDWMDMVRNTIVGSGRQTLPRELFNQDMSVNPVALAVMRIPQGTKAGGQYNALTNTISYPEKESYYTSPFSPGAATRHHEWKHWDQYGRGANGLAQTVPKLLSHALGYLGKGHAGAANENEARDVEHKYFDTAVQQYWQGAQQFIDTQSPHEYIVTPEGSWKPAPNMRIGGNDEYQRPVKSSQTAVAGRDQDQH